MTTIQKKLQKKVEEVNKLISLASNSESENAYEGNLMVVNSGSTWQEPMVYKPVKFTNGVLYIEYYEPYSHKTKKEKILSRNLELDGYGTLLDIAKMYRKALKSENITFAYGGSLIGNQKRIDLNKNGKIDAEDFKLLRSSMNGASRNERKHVNHNEDYEIRYARNKPSRTGYKGKRDFASGGSLENHGLKKGDRIIKTIDGGIQEVKDKDGNIFYVNLANGERSATIPLPFKDGGEVTYFVNKDGIRVRSKVEPKEKLSEKEWMAKHSETKEARAYKKGGKVTFKEKSKAIARNFVGKSVEPKYKKEYGKTYDAKEAKEVGNKIAGAQKAKYDAKAEKGTVIKKKSGNPKMKEAMVLANKIRKDGEKWTDAVKRAYSQLK